MKAKDLRERSAEDLRDLEKSLAKDLFQNRFKNFTNRLDDTSALYPSITRIPYPKVGTTNSAVRIGVVPAAGGTTRWIKVPGDPRNNYLARLDWIDARTIAIQQLNRLQNQNDFYLAGIAT